jgi:HSP20 family protein
MYDLVTGGRLWDAFGALETLQREMNQFTNGRAHVPSIDVVENEKELRITAELPGLEEKDVEVTLDQGVLSLRGEKRFEHEEQGNNFHRVERSYGTFHRAIYLPVDVNADKIEASFRQGVLTVTLPKSEKAQPKKISVKTS